MATPISASTQAMHSPMALGRPTACADCITSMPTYLSLAFPSDPFDTPNMTDDSRDMTTLDRQNPPAG